jgi:hypothetical protein
LKKVRADANMLNAALLGHMQDMIDNSVKRPFSGMILLCKGTNFPCMYLHLQKVSDIC